MADQPHSLQQPTHRFLLLSALLGCLLLLPLPLRAEESPLIERLKDHPVSIQCKNLNISLLLQAIAQQAGITIYTDESIQETITIDMRDRTFYDLFHLIMDVKDFHYYVKNGIVFITKQAVSQAEELQIQQLKVRYGDASQYIEQLSPFLGSGGTISSSNNGDYLIVRDSQKNIGHIAALLETVDKPTPQVFIEARIVTISQAAEKRLGITWGLSGEASRSNTSLPVSAAADLAIDSTSNFTIGFIRDNFNLNLELQALEQENLAELLSSPRILVLDGKEAEIKQGTEVAYVSQSGDSLNTDFREATLSLKVTPKVLGNKNIILDLGVTNDSVDLQTAQGGGQPAINTQEISSTLFLRDGVTVVVGGILQENLDTQEDSVPMLSKVPLLGNLFKANTKANSRFELLIFLTPTIIANNETPPLSASEKAASLAAGPKTPPRQPAPPPEPAPLAAPPEAGHKPLSRPAPPVEEPRTAQAPPPTGSPEYTVQVGIFQEKANAEAVLESLAATSYPFYVEPLSGSAGTLWYALRFGVFSSQSEAKLAARRFSEQEKTPALVRQRHLLSPEEEEEETAVDAGPGAETVEAADSETKDSLPDRPAKPASPPTVLKPRKSKTEAAPAEPLPAYTVQVGAFQHKESAHQIRQDLETKGYPLYIVGFEDQSNTPWYGLRFGEFSTKAEAEAAARQFFEKESRPSYVKPFISRETHEGEEPEGGELTLELVEKKKTAAGSEAGGVTYSVQIGAFRMRKNAEEIETLLAKKGYPLYIVEVEDTSDGIWYALRFGNYHQKERAEQAAEEFEQSEQQPALVRPINSL